MENLVEHTIHIIGHQKVHKPFDVVCGNVLYRKRNMWGSIYNETIS